jgi:WD40 repeat protein
MYTRSLTFSPVGDSLYLGGFLTSQIAEVPTGRVVTEMPFPISVVAVAGRDNEWLVVGDFDGGLRVLDRESLEELFTLEGHSARITDLAVARDGTLLASASGPGGTTFVWDLDTRDQIAVFSCEASQCPGRVALSRDGSLAVSGSLAWEVGTGKPVPGWWTPPAGSVARVALVDDAGVAVVADGSTPQIIDLRDGEILDSLHAHTADVTSIDVSPDGHYVATAGRDGLIHIWELAPAGALRVLTLAGHEGPVWMVEFSPDGKHLASLGGLQDFSADFTQGWPTTWEARLWDISAAGGKEWMSTGAQPLAVAFSPDGSRVLAGNLSSGVSVWDASSGAVLQTFPGPSGDSQNRVAAFSPDGVLVVTGGTTPSGAEATEDDGWVTVWDASTGEPVRNLIPPTPGIMPSQAEFSRDGSLLAIVAGSSVRVWNTATWEVEFTDSEADFPGLFSAASVSPDGELLATQSVFPEELGRLPVAVWSLESGELVSGITQFPRDERGTAVFSPDGRLLLTAGLGRPLVSEVFTRKTLATLKVPDSSYAAGGAFSPDATRIATAEADGTVRLWDATTGEEELVLVGHSAEVTAVAFSPDGTRLASVSFDGILRVWALDIDDLLDIARHSVTRGITDEECRIYIKHGCSPGEASEPLLPLDWEAQDLLGISDQIWAGAASGGSWQQTSPEGYGGAILAYDWQSGRLLVDQDGLRVVDPSSGGKEDTSEAPGTWAAAVYHPETDQIIVYDAEDGGVHGYDVNTDTWTELDSVESRPPANGLDPVTHGPFGDYGQVMVHDIESNVIVLFGGANWGRIDHGNHLGLGETWIYDPAADTWEQSDPETPPPPRVGHSMTYDAQSDVLVLFGGSPGFASDGDLYGDTWVYDANTGTWTDMDPQASPSAREAAVMWYDPVVDLVFLFGGVKGEGLPWEVFGGEELWGYDYETNTWTLFRVDPNPGYRAGSAAVFDVQEGEAMLFGGDRYDVDRRRQGEVGDMWTYRHDDGGD